MKTKLLILSAVLFSLITVSCKSDSTKCVDNIIETIANAKSDKELAKIKELYDIFSLYNPGYDNGEKYKEYMHNVINELSERIDEFRAAFMNNKYLSENIQVLSASEMKEQIEPLHKWIDDAEVTIDGNEVTIKNGWDVIKFNKD